jgi:hypothetical protein
VRVRGARLIILLFLAGACTPTRDQSLPGRLEVEWTGSDPGKIAGPATAEWCAGRRLLEIRAVQGDTGIALALYPAETLAAGRYPVVDPIRAESVPPAAGVALRWLTKTAVQGLQGDSGVVQLERSGPGQVSGRVSARARSVVDTLRVTVRGTFRDLNVGPESRGCTAPSEHPNETAEAADTGVH